MKDGLTRTAGASEPLRGPTPAPVWILADELADQADAWAGRHVVGRTVPPRRLGPSRDAPFHATALLRLEPHVGLTACYRPAADDTVTAAGDILPAGGLMLLRPSSGAMIVALSGRTAVATGREAILVAGTRTTIRLAGVDRLDWLELPEAELSAAMSGAAQSLRVFAEDNAALSLLGRYGAALMRGLLPIPTATLRDHAIRHMAGLVEIMCADTAVLPKGDRADRHADRLRAIKAEIEIRLGERTMGARHVAELSGMSVRSLQKLFETAGQTFSEFVLERRLERALRLLQAPAKRRRSISEIAFEVGFGDLSYFNRTFRKRFGMSPRSARLSDGAAAG